MKQKPLKSMSDDNFNEFCKPVNDYIIPFQAPSFVKTKQHLKIMLGRWCGIQKMQQSRSHQQPAQLLDQVATRK